MAKANPPPYFAFCRKLLTRRQNADPVRTSLDYKCSSLSGEQLAHRSTDNDDDDTTVTFFPPLLILPETPCPIPSSPRFTTSNNLKRNGRWFINFIAFVCAAATFQLNPGPLRLVSSCRHLHYVPLLDFIAIFHYSLASGVSLSPRFVQFSNGIWSKGGVLLYRWVISLSSDS